MWIFKEGDRMKINNVTIVGAGTMGHGIAQVFAVAGFQVTLNDVSAEILGSAIPRIQENLETCVKYNTISEDEAAAATDRITLTADLEKATSQADFIMESVIEDLDVKLKLLSELEGNCPAHTILTSTTSSYCVREMAVELGHPERFLITHYWNPPYIIPVVEVMPGDATSPEVIETTFNLLETVGKYPAMVNNDVPGFVGNRLQHALRREAIAIVAQGIASPEDVDLIAKLSFGLRLPVVGPLETVDLGGLDLTQAIQKNLLPELDRSTEPLSLIRDKVEKGELGAKAGKGFYDWSPGREEKVIQRRDQILIELVKFLDERGYL
jgi:3-hydroxyacyl-CoA dehydrogenase